MPARSWFSPSLLFKSVFICVGPSGSESVVEILSRKFVKFVSRDFFKKNGQFSILASMYN
jgi:hypothetical protein